MFVEDVGGDNTLFLMTRHPSSSCRCEDGSCTCGSRENTWIGSCSNGLISFTKELSANDAWIGSFSNGLISMTEELRCNDEEPGTKGPCTGVVSSETLFIQCGSSSEKYNKA
eukprot:TRINITY_DN3276_c1_g1_i2.p3 TRINITY_DN3276_c1_g1~~TRINITY_DN3276_c1_g1_i2.p3  ORF type:complete len:112 (-),score=18.25 TRINITY_DN3276_c1_g1_i2:51-386(-)